MTQFNVILLALTQSESRLPFNLFEPHLNRMRCIAKQFFLPLCHHTPLNQRLRLKRGDVDSPFHLKWRMV
jgi:hypothetical protein